MKCGARYSQSTHKPTVWYPPSSPCICCLGLFFLEMGRSIWIKLDNLHSSVRVSGAHHLDRSRETGRSAQVPCGEGDCTACSSVNSTAEVCAAPLFPTGYHTYHVKTRSSSRSLNTWASAAMRVQAVSPSPFFLLPSVLPTVFEEWVPYSCPAFKMITLPFTVNRINKIANPYVRICANC